MAEACKTFNRKIEKGVRKDVSGDSRHKDRQQFKTVLLEGSNSLIHNSKS